MNSNYDMSKTICPDGIQAGSPCPSVPGRGMQTCPNGEIVHAGTRCPNSPRKYKLAVTDTVLYTSIGVAVAIGMVFVGALTGWAAKRKLTIA